MKLGPLDFFHACIFLVLWLLPLRHWTRRVARLEMENRRLTVQLLRARFDALDAHKASPDEGEAP